MTTSGDSGEAEGRQVLDAADIARALRRMAGEIAERNNGVAGVALVGVRCIASSFGLRKFDGCIGRESTPDGAHI